MSSSYDGLANIFSSVLAYMGLPLQIFGKVSIAIYVHYKGYINLTPLSGKHVRTLYPSTAAGSASR